MALALPFAFKWPKQASWLRYTPLGKVLNNFNTFYITHQIFFLTFVTLFMIHPVPGHSHVHGKRTYLPVPYSWMWISWPFALYIGERIFGLSRAQHWDIQTMGASILDTGVLTLELTKPRGFSYTPGQFVLIQCGDISTYEWHPFSLTSAPADNFLQAPRLRIDGPFGAPAQEHAKFRKVLLIGMGTGIAPMLSIMRDTLHRLAALPSDPPGLQADDKSKKVEQRKAYMHWVVRDPCAANWLKYEFQIMSLLDVTGSVFTSHVHVTGGQTAEVPLPQECESDPYRHSSVKLSTGRPDFEAILKGIQAEVGRARVGVFLCGPRPARNAIRKLCARVTSTGDTTFIFHAERL
ncbi:Respiratory burst oxidase homolog protein B [Coccomyxa sp. Obi]|nr:Respiratory burst oxidase homolog protein B [Coccomyxa sp. Obi]